MIVSFSPINNTLPEAVCRRKLIVKNDEQLALAENSDYQPTKMKRVKDEDGNVQKVEAKKY